MTDKELQTLYISAKISYNPLEYTLSDRLLMEKSEYLPTIINFGYDSEDYLVGKIAKHLHTSKGIDMYNKDSVYSGVFKQPVGHGIVHRYDTYNECSLLMNYRNNLSVDENVLKNLISRVVDGVVYKGRSVKDRQYIDDLLENGNFLESIVTLNIALRDASSILPVLKLAEFTEYLAYTYEELLNGKYILDYIESSEPNIPLGFTVIRDSPICSNIAFDNAFSPKYYTISNDDSKFLSKLSCFNTVLYGMEILHAVETIKNDAVKNTLYYMLSANYSPDSIASMLYSVEGKKIVINKDILKIIGISDNRKRFKEMSLYMCNPKVLETIDTFGENLVSISSVGAPDFLSLMVTFCMEYSLQCVRTKAIMVLLDYIKTNKIKLDDVGSSISEPEGLGGIFALPAEDEEDDSAGTSSSAEPKSKEMLDFHKHIDGLPKALPDKPSEKFKKTPALLSLDEEISSFKDEKFEYDVKDVIDTSNKYKDKYEAIVDNVSLLNKNLIKRIKEIKVYNEGGKNPGLSSGKLDMKNIHKYRITDKIFYKNTYKIKESDLAFGIILDVSGSMHGDGIKNGVITMVILHETLKALNINHSIVTHTEHKGYHTCEIKRYQNFREQKTYNVRKNYALAGIRAESGNCDAAALKYMETAFSRVRNKDKICLIFSDGEPTECSDSELLEQISHMERNGIKVIGIGVNFSNIKEYYRDNANGKNLKDMLDIVSDILKQYILDKKE